MRREEGKDSWLARRWWSGKMKRGDETRDTCCYEKVGQRWRMDGRATAGIWGRRPSTQLRSAAGRNDPVSIINSITSARAPTNQLHLLHLPPFILSVYIQHLTVYMRSGYIADRSGWWIGPSKWTFCQQWLPGRAQQQPNIERLAGRSVGRSVGK